MKEIIPGKTVTDTELTKHYRPLQRRSCKKVESVTSGGAELNRRHQTPTDKSAPIELVGGETQVPTQTRTAAAFSRRFFNLHIKNGGAFFFPTVDGSGSREPDGRRLCLHIPAQDAATGTQCPNLGANGLYAAGHEYR